MPWALWGLGLRCLSIAVCFLSLDVDRNGAHLKNWCWQENIIMLLFESEYELPLHPLYWIIIVHAEIPVYFFGWGCLGYIMVYPIFQTLHRYGTKTPLKANPNAVAQSQGPVLKIHPLAVKNSAGSWPKWWNPLKHVNSWGFIWWNQHEKPKFSAVSTRKTTFQTRFIFGGPNY